jgi:hypothetical protein
VITARVLGCIRWFVMRKCTNFLRDATIVYQSTHYPIDKNLSSKSKSVLSKIDASFFKKTHKPTLCVCCTKGSAKNNLVEFAPEFAVDLIDLIEQNRRNSELFRGLL